MIRKRPLIAVALALYPGLGHAYLRRWFRALLWFGLAVSALVFVVPPEAVEGSISMAATFELLSEELSTVEELALVSVFAFNMVDAYVLAEHAERMRGTDVPVCGGELDEELEFCHWCTTRFDELAEQEAQS